jgi:hypothetical protein
VIGEGQAVQARQLGAANEGGRGEDAVGGAAVAVQVVAQEGLLTGWGKELAY